jgi:hypothetical protein
LQDGTVGLSPSILNFGLQVVGIGSSKNVTLTNAGTALLAISSIAITGTDASDFVQSHTCGSGLDAGASCTISVTFKPENLGPVSASLTITDNGPGSPQSVALSGTGVNSGPNVTLSATSLTFATQLLGTASPAQSIMLSNYGTETLNVFFAITGADPGDFAQTNTCGSSVAAGANCTINVTFKPTGINGRSASLSIRDNASGSPQTVNLNGTGTVVELNPTSLSFGLHPVGTPLILSTTLTNVGSTALSIAGIAIAGADTDAFSQTNTCGTTVGAGKSCTISVTFTPHKGADSAEVSISDNGGGSPQQVSLSGTGCVFETISRHQYCIP